MPAFPILKTGAVAQYPAVKSAQFRNQTVRFVDGAEQRYRDAAGPLHVWEIRLSQLDETEMAAVEQFFLLNQGRQGSFAFTDPWDGAVYPECSLQSDEIALEYQAELRGRTSLTVRELRS